MIKVLFIAYHFPPEGSVAVQRSLRFVEGLPDEGFLPVVVAGPSPVTGMPNLVDDSLVNRIPAAVPIYRVPPRTAQSYGRCHSVAERWLGLPSAFSRWWVRGLEKISRTIEHDVQLIYASMSPFESGEGAREISSQRGIPWVADLRDPWALDEFTISPTVLHRKLEMRRMERLLSTAALIIVNTPEVNEVLRRAFPSLDNKTIVTITNGYCETDFSCAVTARADSKFRIVHSGGFSPGVGLWLRRKRVYCALGGAVRGVDFLTRSPLFFLRAIDRWSKRRPEVLRDLEIVFAGKVTETDRAIAKESPTGRLVRFLGYLPHLESVNLVRTADLLFFAMHNLPRGERARTIQAKTYEYMASGSPILAAVPEGDARDFLKGCGTALLCWPDDVGGMVEQLDKAYDGWRVGRPIGPMNRSFVEQFGGRRQTAKLVAAFNKVV